MGEFSNTEVVYVVMSYGDGDLKGVKELFARLLVQGDTFKAVAMVVGT